MDTNETFEITETSRDGVPILSVAGEIDVATAPPLRERIHRQVGSGATQLVVDLLNVTFLDSTALGVLVGAVNRLREAGGDLLLVIDKRRVLKVFEITGLTEVFSIHRSTADALASVRVDGKPTGGNEAPQR